MKEERTHSMDDQLTRMMQFIQSMQQGGWDNGTMHKNGGNYGYSDILMSMRPMLPYRKQRMIDLMIKATEMQEIWDELNISL